MLSPGGQPALRRRILSASGENGAVTRSTGYERYARDSTLVLGGGAAILLQLADPVVAAGVAAHSAFADDPVRRLRHTLGYVYAIMLGDAETVRRAAGYVDRAHAGVPGATDPDRQLWVAATLYRVGVQVHELIREFVKGGGAALVISSDLPEVLALGDRILVMREGRQMGILDNAEATQEKVMAIATGQADMRLAS